MDQREQHAMIYTLVVCDALPSIDPSITIKKRLLSPQCLVQYTNFMVKYGGFISLSGWIGTAIATAVLFVPAPMGRLIAPFAPLFSFPGTLSILLSLRIELFVLILQTFDFWYSTLVNVLLAVSFIMIFNDIRASILPLVWLNYQFSSLVDANLRNPRETMHWALLHIMDIVIIAVATFFDLIHEAKYDTVMHFDAANRMLSTRDLVMNGLGTLAVLYVRNLIRKRQFLKRLQARPRQPTNSELNTMMIVDLITYRCRLRLERLEQLIVSDQLIPPERCASSVQEPTTTRVPLRHEAIPMRFEAANKTFQWPLRICDSIWRIPWLVMWYGSALMGICTTVLVFVLRISATKRQATSSLLLPIVSLISTVLFLVVCFTLYERQLLRRLFRSFDVGFLSIQSLLAHVCVCDVFDWDAGVCMAVVSSCLWFHWILTLDALLPCDRQALMFDRKIGQWIVTLVLVLMLSGQLLLTLELTVWNGWSLSDRQMLNITVFGHSLQYRVVPFLHNRLFTLVLWCLRLLWRLSTKPHPNEMIMLLGGVEYSYTSSRKRRRASSRHRPPWFRFRKPKVGPSPPS